MRKFSELSNNDKKVETSTDKKDFIQNLVEEALTVVDGKIVGKDTLVKTLNKIIEMNDSKTKIQVLESVKVNAYRGGFDFNKISEAIELEKQRLNLPIQEEVVEEPQRDIFFAKPNDKIVSMSESVNTDVDEEVEETVEESVEETVEESVEETVEESVEEETTEDVERYELADGRILEAHEDGTIIDTETGEELSEEEIENIELVEEKKEECDEEECDDEKEKKEDCDEECDEEECDDEKEPIKESVKGADEEEGDEKDDDDDAKDEEEGDEKCDDDCDDECDEKEGDEKEVKESVENDSAVTEVQFIVSDYEKEKSSLTSIYESILNDNRPETKKDKVKFILDNIDKVEVEGENKEAALENMSDSEIDSLLEKIEGTGDSK